MSESSDSYPNPTRLSRSEPAAGPNAAPRSRRAPTLDVGMPARQAKASNSNVSAPIVPAGSVTGRSLTLVISIMCFLACLTASAVYLINQSATAWMHNIASEVTLQVDPGDPVETEQKVTKIALFLARQKGIVSVRPLTPEEGSELLEPWLGKTDVLKSLPIPRLIAIELDRSEPPDLEALRSTIAGSFQGVNLDDHRHWQVQIRTVTRSLALSGLAILILVGAATTAIIMSATNSAMAANREIVEVLHFVGATDRFIAREFEKHFLALGVRAGLVGALAAMAVFFLLPLLAPLLGGGAVTAAELRNLFGQGSLDFAGFLLLGIVVIVVAALCMLTSRYGVFRILNVRN